MPPDIFEFIKWQVAVGIPFFGIILTAMGLFNRQRRMRQEEMDAKITALDIKVDVRLRPTEDEIKALQAQVRALELEIARNYVSRDEVEKLFDVISTSLSNQIKEVKVEIQQITAFLIKGKTA